ncbi:MAG TPA: AAA family ATPase [Bryobacteraceae bacterium]|nr:AAA family ATPase [Bryobacteraceae bacterium]
MIRFDQYRLDPVQGLWRGSIDVRITPKSLALLCVLAERTGEVVTKEELFRAVWPGTAVTDSALTSCIRELRSVLGDTARRPRFIETLHRRGYRFRAPTLTGSPDGGPNVGPPAPIHTDAPLIGRELVFAGMLDAFTRAEHGSRQVLFVTGEPGIGKTTVVRAFLARARSRDNVRATWGQSIEHYGVGEPYQPLLEALTRLCQQPGGDRIVHLLERYSPTWLAQIPALLAPEHLVSLQRTAAGTTRERMLRELNDAVEAITAEAPLILWLEDLHWSDMSTLDWVVAFAQRPEPARLLLIATFWPPAVSGTEHPLAEVVERLREKGLSREIALGGLDEGGVADYVALRFPPATGHNERMRQLARVVQQHTGGNPLFVVNILGDLVERGLLLEQDGRWTVSGDAGEPALGIPDGLRRAIERQVNRLLPDERFILEIASGAGATFSAAAVAVAAGRELDEVEITLTALARQRRFVQEGVAVEWPDGTISAGFDFLHVLYRDVLYQRIPASRRADLHWKIGERQETAYGQRSPEIAAELAMHFERSRDLHRAGIYRQHAAENARRRNAYKEAQLHFKKALMLLANEPPGQERTEHEVALQIGLGAVLMATHGWGAPEVEHPYSRAYELCHGLGDTPRIFPALWGLWLYYLGQGPLSIAHNLAQDLMTLARRHDDRQLLLQAHHSGWATAFLRGDLDAARIHSTSAIGIYQVERHAAMAATYGSHDAAVCGQYFLGLTLALQARMDEAARACNQCIALAQELSHPMSLALAQVFTAAVGQMQRDSDAVRIHAEAAVATAREQDFRLILGWAWPLEGWAAIEHQQYREGLDLISRGLAEVRATGSNSWMTYLLGLHADALLKGGQAVAGLQALDEAFAVSGRTGERFWEAELHRLKGELLLAASASSAKHEAEQVFLRAIEIARSQGAKLLVLRAAVSLGRLWCRRGRRAEAGLIVAEARRAIDGPAFPDMVEADSLLAESGGRAAPKSPPMDL